MIRKYHDETGNPDKFRVITFKGAFHGRTITTISAGGPGKNTQGFEPLLEGFDQAPFGDLDAVKAAITPETGGILVEPVQGEVVLFQRQKASFRVCAMCVTNMPYC